MQIGNLFELDIDRRINAAVVVSEMDENSIKQEINEYIFTPDIIGNIYKFLDAITRSKKSKTGVWINGYYGSGKSHFIKYLFYCLNQAYRTDAIKNFLDNIKEQKETITEITLSNANLLAKKLDKFEVDEIIFNIDVVSGEKNKDAITKVLLNQFNKFRGFNDTNIPLALLIEKTLAEKGQFEDFQKKAKAKCGYEWKGNEERYYYKYLKQVIEIAKELDPNIDPQSLRNAILYPKDYRIEDLINEFRDYLKTKGKDYRLIFLLDEMSQYIGSNTSLLLNLQSIIEEIGTYCNGKIWIVCTAQQDLGNLIDNRDNKTEDFGKILGRFETMISLQSQDAAFITKKRVLDKSQSGTKHLTDYFQDNKVAIKNQFVVVHDLYNNYKDQEDFLLTYPFIPYQFRLITDVFAAFSQSKYVGEGVRDTERSILGITHFTAQLCKEEGVGYFVPFDLFFDEQLKKNLTHHANNIITRAYNIELVKRDAFAVRVVEVLFMISSLSESLQINFPATVENIALLLMDNLSVTKADLEKQTEAVLTELVNQKIIQESENIYRFLKEDEIEVANLIDNTAVNTEYQLERLYHDILIKVIGSPKNNYAFGNNSFRGAIKIDDKQIGIRGDFQIQFLFFDQQDAENIALNVSKTDLIVCCNEWFIKDKTLRKIFLKYAKTVRFIELNSSSAQGTRKNTIQGFALERDKIRELLIKQIDAAFLTTRFVSGQNIIKATELHKRKSKERYEEVIQKHLAEIYNKNNYVRNYVKTNSELRIKAADTSQLTIKDLTPAEEEVENYLNFQVEGIAVGDVVKHFLKAPYGWKDLSTLHVFIALARKEKRRYELRNEPLELKKFAIDAINSRTRDAITIFKEKGFSPAQISNFVDNINHHIFAETLVSSNDLDIKRLINDFKNKLKEKLRTAKELKEAHEGNAYNAHFKAFHTMVRSFYEERNNTKILDLAEQSKVEFQGIRDRYKQLQDFVEKRSSNMTTFREFVREHRQNFRTLDTDQQQLGQELITFLKEDDKPWIRFPQMKKAHKQLKRSLSSKIKEIQNKVIERYKAAYDELEAKQTELGLDYMLPDRGFKIEALRKNKTITELQLAESRLKNFKAEQLKALYDAVPKPPAPMPPPKATKSGDTPTTPPKPTNPYSEPKRATIYAVNEDTDLATQIENEEQLNDYINTLRAKLLAELRDNKIIILK